MVKKAAKNSLKGSTIFSLVWAGLAFACFLFVYCALTLWTVVPIYGKGLLFIVPAVIFMLLAFFAQKSKGEGIWTVVVGAVCVPLSFFCAQVLFFYIAFTASDTTNVDYYERAIRYSSYDNFVEETGLDFLPESLPEGAEEVSFYYTPQILQGSETISVCFTAPADWLRAYEAEFLQNAVEKDELLSGGERYMLYREGYNHGTFCYVEVERGTNCVNLVYSAG